MTDTFITLEFEQIREQLLSYAATQNARDRIAELWIIYEDQVLQRLNGNAQCQPSEGMQEGYVCDQPS